MTSPSRKPKFTIKFGNITYTSDVGITSTGMAALHVWSCASDKTYRYDANGNLFKGDIL